MSLQVRWIGLLCRRIPFDSRDLRRLKRKLAEFLAQFSPAQRKQALQAKIGLQEDRLLSEKLPKSFR
jgi:hypothetical protein